MVALELGEWTQWCYFWYPTVVINLFVPGATTYHHLFKIAFQNHLHFLHKRDITQLLKGMK